LSFALNVEHIAANTNTAILTTLDVAILCVDIYTVSNDFVTS